MYFQMQIKSTPLSLSLSLALSYPLLSDKEYNLASIT